MQMLYLLLVCVFIGAVCGVQWKHVAGPKEVGQPSVYSGDVYPGAVSSAAYTMYDGKFYLFGGEGYDLTDNYGKLNDLWSYDPVADSWEHLFGAKEKDPDATYGSSPMPGSISDTSMIGYNDALYVFGGIGRDNDDYGEGFLNNMWKYDLTTNTWSLLGDGFRAYTKSNYTAPYPGGLFYCKLVAEEEMIYIFGGNGYTADSASSGGGFLNDLWSFNMTSETWEHLDGSKTEDPKADYTTPRPGGLTQYGAEIKDGVIYIFCGQGFDVNEQSQTNDVWSYTISSNTWAHVSGAKEVDADPDYSVPTVGAIRQFGTVLKGNKIYLLGGTGNYATYFGDNAEVWSFDIATQKYTVEFKDSRFTAKADYELELPGGFEDAAIGLSGDLIYVFGGQGQTDTAVGKMNDLWSFDTTGTPVNTNTDSTSEEPDTTSESESGSIPDSASGLVCAMLGLVIALAFV